MIYGALLDTSEEGTLREVIEDATSCTNMGVAGEVMLKGLFNTPPVRPPSSGQKAGCRSKVGDNLSSSSQKGGQLELSMSSGVGCTTIVARQ